MAWKFLFKLRLPRRSHVVKGFWPRLQARLADDPVKLGPKVAIRRSVLRDDVFRPFVGRLERRQYVGAQLREERDQPGLPALVMLGFRRRDQNAGVLPIDVLPLQRKMFRRAPQAPIAAQSDDQSPFGVRARVQHLVRVLGRNVVHPSLDRSNCDGQSIEWVRPPQKVPANRGLEELSGAAGVPPNGVLCQPVVEHKCAEVVGVAGADGAHVSVFTEEVDKPAPGLLEIGDRVGLAAAVAGLDQRIDERGQDSATPCRSGTSPTAASRP